MPVEFSSLFPLVGLAGAVGGVVGFLSYGRAKTIIELQQSEIKAREERFNTISEQLTEVKSQYAAAEARSKVLQELVTQAPNIERLATAQSKQHQEVISALSEVTTQLSHLVETLSNNTQGSK